MASVATEEGVRARFQWSEEDVPESLITLAIEDAHNRLVRALTAESWGETPASGVVLGETLLAGAQVYRLLAAREAFDRRDVRVGGQESVGIGRFEALSRTATALEDEAWAVLEAFTRMHEGRAPMSASDTVPVLGEG